MKSGTHHITHRSTAALALAGALAAVITAAGCDYLPFGYTSIQEISAAPGRFEGREVKLKGRVTSVVRMLGVTAYSLQDDTGNITIVTDKQLPQENSDVALRGIVKSAAIIGGTAIGLKVDETERLR